MLNKLKEIKCDGHYLTKVNCNYDLYIQGLVEIISQLKTKISKNKFNDLVSKKLQIDLNIFNESQYIQTACELSVMSNFINMEGIEFIYEKKVTPPKDVDFTIIIDSVNYNVEIKCPSYKAKEEVNDKKVQVICTNRTPDISEKNIIIEDISKKLDIHNIEVSEGKNLDNTLKDFLTSTQGKVNKSSIQDVNILVVCCDDALDMHIWRGYLFGFSGFFTENSYIDHVNFNRVDYVLLTNLYNRHNRYYEKSILSKHWELSSAFNLLYPNRYSIRNKNVIGEVDLKKLNNIFSNHNIKFEEYMKNERNIPLGESQDAKELLGVSWFSDQFKNSGVYYFS